MSIMKRLRRHRPGGIETTTVDSLEEGDWIRQHRDGLQLGERVVGWSRTWVVIEEIRRFGNGDVEITFFNPKRLHQSRPIRDFVHCFPETLVKRRMEHER